ncbi:MAG TPA: dockerin type I domain-containing protein [Fimbriimonadaceae bacterium]|nr:dockerin type I domain-containing protein [Fimbriimonadaceae bacterium]HRJ96646.1 dockerin type I domain-containing protein [Fimbriimonadaceae bacterium]
MRQTTLLLAMSIAVSAGATTWNASADWSDATNPFGAWSLLQAPSSLFTTNWNPWDPGTNQAAWAARPLPYNDHVPMWARATISRVYNMDLPRGTVFMHGAETERTATEYSCLRWTSPINGTVYLCGETWMPRNIGRWMNSFIQVNGLTVSQASFIAPNTFSSQFPLRFEDFSGGTSALTVQVVPGTTIDFVMMREPDQASADFLAGYFAISTHPFGTYLMVDGELQDYLGDETAVPITVTIQDGGGNVIRESTINLSSESAIPIRACVEGEYTVCVKAPHWLRQCQQVTFGEFGGDLSFSLVNGDCDGDNEISIGDYALLSSAFGAIPGDPNWNANADLLGDDEVDIGDFAILSNNFGLEGD